MVKKFGFGLSENYNLSSLFPRTQWQKETTYTNFTGAMILASDLTCGIGALWPESPRPGTSSLQLRS